MASFYIDTCSLKWKYLPGNPTADVERIMNDAGNKVQTVELTLLEWSSALASSCREGHIDHNTFKRNELALMTDIVNDRLMILPLMPRIIEKARSLIEYVGVVERRSLKSGDAIQLASALQASNNVDDKMTFVTSDERLAKIIQRVQSIQERLDTLHLIP